MWLEQEEVDAEAVEISWPIVSRIRQQYVERGLVVALDRGRHLF